MSALVNNSFHGEGKVLELFARPDQSLINRIYSSVVVHVAAGFIGKTDYLLRPYYMMLTNPIILEVSIYYNIIYKIFTSQVLPNFQFTFLCIVDTIMYST